MEMQFVIDKILEILPDLGIEDASAGDALMDDLGLSSMEVFVLMGDIEKALSIKIPERVLMRVSTVEDLAAEICKLSR